MLWSVLHFIGRKTHWNRLRDFAFLQLLRIELDKNLTKQMAHGDKKFKAMAKMGYKPAEPEESNFHQSGAQMPRWTTYDPRSGKLSIHLESYETVKDILSGKSNGR